MPLDCGFALLWRKLFSGEEKPERNRLIFLAVNSGGSRELGDLCIYALNPIYVQGADGWLNINCDRNQSLWKIDDVSIIGCWTKWYGDLLNLNWKSRPAIQRQDPNAHCRY